MIYSNFIISAFKNGSVVFVSFSFCVNADTYSRKMQWMHTNIEQTVYYFILHLFLIASATFSCSCLIFYSLETEN